MSSNFFWNGVPVDKVFTDETPPVTTGSIVSFAAFGPNATYVDPSMNNNLNGVTNADTTLAGSLLISQDTPFYKSANHDDIGQYIMRQYKDFTETSTIFNKHEHYYPKSLAVYMIGGAGGRGGGGGNSTNKPKNNFNQGSSHNRHGGLGGIGGTGGQYMGTIDSNNYNTADWENLGVSIGKAGSAGSEGGNVSKKTDSNGVKGGNGGNGGNGNDTHIGVCTFDSNDNIINITSDVVAGGGGGGKGGNGAITNNQGGNNGEVGAPGTSGINNTTDYNGTYSMYGGANFLSQTSPINLPVNYIWNPSTYTVNNGRSDTIMNAGNGGWKPANGNTKNTSTGDDFVDSTNGYARIVFLYD